MSVYIDRANCPDLNDIPASVINYVIREHNKRLPRLQMLRDYFLGKNKVKDLVEGGSPTVVNLPRYTVELLSGYYLGNPVKYSAKDDNNEPLFIDGVPVAVVNGRLVRHYSWLPDQSDISQLVRCYDRQSISELDYRIGLDLGIYGEAYELLYASSDKEPYPKSCLWSPLACEMVRDNSIDHCKLFFFTYELRRNLNGTSYYVVNVYTDTHVHEYTSTSLMGKRLSMKDLQFSHSKPPERHFFGEVPAIEYQNGPNRTADFEPALSVLDAYNTLMSNRCIDKSKFVDSVLALYGYTLNDDDVTRLKDQKFIDSIPVDGRMEYVQKVFDEASVHILCQDLLNDYHRITFTVDLMSDVFAGNSSGQALKLKFMAMNIIIKTKIRNMEKGLRKRFEMYNHWLHVIGLMPELDRDDFEPVFTVSPLVDEAGIVSMVKQLQGIVDDETLLSQLWFVRDPKAVVERVRQQRSEPSNPGAVS